MAQEESIRPGSSIVGIRFADGGAVAVCDAGQLILRSGEQVLVDREGGHAIGTVISVPFGAPRAGGPRVRIIKRADRNDLEREERNRTRAREALRTCVQRVRERQMPMKLIKAEPAFEGGKLVFYFSAEERIDFRDLVRELAHLLHTRVEMKQIGARDEARVIGAAGPCGRELCCSTWLPDFAVVSVKMAKAQGLSLNPSKLAGMCGRLKCCLRYEYDTYLELGRQLPPIGKSVVSVKGDGVVTRHHTLKQTVTIRRSDGVEAEVTLEDLVEKKPE